MSFVADLHVHSYLSRATSPQCTLEGFHRWAQLKGVRLVGTGDFTHPEWFAALREKLTESAPGLYRLRPELAAPVDADTPESCRSPVDFVITGEISSIYKRDGRVRKVHTLLFVPDLDTAEKINARLDALGNIKSDGRPILGLDPRVLLEIVLEVNPDAYLIPAHIWTPWFSMLGSKSGFDSLVECFGDLSEHIFAAETGLSSDPPMNWRVSSLDDLCLVSNSDLHSPPKMGRNANVFHCEPDFFAVREALKSKDPAQCGGTIELFPEEGKYHFDGHRKCDVCLEPEESLARDGLCPECGKPLVLGVLHRVVKLADRPKGGKPASALPCRYIIPLTEILAEIYSCGAATKKVARAYHGLLHEFGPELPMLMELDIERLAGTDPPLLDEAVRRVRNGRVIRQPGYDGEYGVIRVFEDGEKDKLKNQAVLFSVPPLDRPERTRGSSSRHATAAAESRTPYDASTVAAATPTTMGQLTFVQTDNILDGLTDDQRRAASTTDAPVIIVAGPGTGKTRTLTHRIAHLISDLAVEPRTVLAVTFTNRAADEMRDRLRRLLGARADGVTVATFHAFCVGLLRRHAEAARLPENFTLVDQDDEAALLRKKAGMKAGEAAGIAEAVGRARRNLEDPATIQGFGELDGALAEKHALSLDDVVPRTVRLIEENPDVRRQIGHQWMCVDEYQDINRAQYALVSLLCPEGRGLCVIGDPDQAIYGFRGSDVSYFLRFTQDFPSAKVFGLDRNFRSTESIVAAAGQVIAPGKTAMSVATSSALEAGVRIRFHSAATARAEAEFITHEIEKCLGGTGFFSVDSARVTGHDASNEIGFSDIAVLVRLRALMKPLAEALSRLGLPVQVVGDQPFADHPGARRVIETLWGAPALEQAMPASRAVAQLISQRKGKAGADGAFEECCKLANDFTGTLRGFLDHLLLRQGSDRYNGRSERIAVMTLHAAKGLEFPIVFVAGCEAGILPYARPGQQPDVDEERRLLYVGMTRAQQLLTITSARRRTLFGKTGRREPSPFVREIEDRLKETIKARKRRRRPSGKQAEFDFPD